MGFEVVGGRLWPLFSPNVLALEVALVQLPAEAECAIWSRFCPLDFCSAVCLLGNISLFQLRLVSPDFHVSQQMFRAFWTLEGESVVRHNVQTWGLRL